jgi:tetratricopeptide (TPR) repeat protein
MLKSLCCILLVSLLCSSVAAQSSLDDTDTIYIYTTLECEQAAQAIIETVKINLPTYDYEFVITTPPEFSSLRPDQTYMTLASSCTEFDDILVSIVGRSSNEISEISPTLFSTYDFNPVGDVSYTLGNPTTIEFTAAYLTAVSLYSANQCDDAKPYFDAAAEMLSSDINVTGKFYRARVALPFYMANCALIAGSYPDAMTYFQQALLRNGDMLDIYAIYPAVNLAWTYLQTNDEQKALETIDLALQAANYWAGVTPSWVTFYIKIKTLHARIYTLTSKVDVGIADMNEAIQTATDPEIIYKPSSQFIASLYLLRGQMYLTLYEWDSALADYNKAIELDPDYADAYYERGVLYYSILQTGVELREDALADFQHYLELAPEGDKAEDATRYVEQIEKELEALNG